MSANATPAFDWQELDHTLANLMLADVAEEMRAKIRQDEARIRLENQANQNVYTIPAKILEMQLQRTDEWARRTYDVYCDVWQRQGRQLVPGFLRAVSTNGIGTLIAARTSAAIEDLQLTAQRTRAYSASWLQPKTVGFRRDMNRLFAKWQRQIEIKAKTLEYGQAEPQVIANRGNEHRADTRDLLRLPAGLQSPDPVEGNPFSPNDPRYRIWEDATRVAEQKVHLFVAAFSDALAEIPLPKGEDEICRYLIARWGHHVTTKYDIWAERGVHVVWNNEEVKAFDQWLANYANAWLKTVKAFFPADIDSDLLLQELRQLLIGRMEFWKSEARRYVSEQKATLAARANTHLSDSKGAKGVDRRRTKAEFWHSEDYRTIGLRGKKYHLSYNQAAIVRVLNEAWERGTCEVGRNELQAKAKCGKISDSFRTGDGPKVWKALIVTVSRAQGIYKLNLTGRNKQSTD